MEPNLDAAPAATATADRYVRRAAADGDSDRTDKAAQRPSQGTGDTPVTNPKPKEKLAEVSDGSYQKTDYNRGNCDTSRATLTDAEREAVAVAMHRCDGPEYKTLRGLLERMAAANSRDDRRSVGGEHAGSAAASPSAASAGSLCLGPR